MVIVYLINTQILTSGYDVNHKISQLELSHHRLYLFI